MQNKFSLIIPTLDRYLYLINLLKEIETQTITPDEIIIIDQSVFTENKDLLNFLKSYKMRINIKYVKLPPQGSGKARNIAVSIASNEFLIFIDDDIEIRNPQLFENYLIHLNNENFNFVEGAYLDDPQRKIERYLPDFKNPNIIFTLFSTYFNKNSNLRTVLGLCAGNFACKKSKFVEIGGFDQRYGQSDDIDIGVRIFSSGYFIINDKNLRVFHYKAKSGGLRNNSKNSIWSSFLKFKPNKYFFAFFLKNFSKIQLIVYIYSLILNYLRFLNIKKILIFPGYLYLIIKSLIEGIKLNKSTQKIYYQDYYEELKNVNFLNFD